MPMYSEKYRRFKNAEFLGWRGMNLPSFPDLSEKQVIYICDKITEYYSGE
jgi:perosamine synthetase